MEVNSEISVRLFLYTTYTKRVAVFEQWDFGLKTDGKNLRNIVKKYFTVVTARSNHSRNNLALRDVDSAEKPKQENYEHDAVE